MTKPKPLVSIIVPTFNRSSLLKETVDSIVNQTYQDWECIIVDDGSTDGTDQMIANLFNIDSRIKFFHRPDNIKCGGNGARNFGFMQSSGDYIKWLDSDDLLEMDTLTREYAIIHKNRPDLIISNWRRFRGNTFLEIQNKVTAAKPKNGYEVIVCLGKNKTHVQPGAYSISRKLVMEVGLWNESLKLNQDGEFFIRICLSTKSVCSIEDIAVFCRADNTDKITKNYSFEHYEQRLKSWCLIKANLNLADENLFSEYLSVNIESMYFYLSNNYKWKLIDKYNYLFSENLRITPMYKVYLLRIIKRITKYFNV